MQDSTFWAHSVRGQGSGPDCRKGWQPLANHLEAVATLAESLAKEARPDDQSFAALVRLGGLLHDYGKYTKCFQRMLRTGEGRCQHAIHGAFLAHFGCCPAGNRPVPPHLAAAIAGHHAGLPDVSGDWRSLQSRFKNGERYKQEAYELLNCAGNDCAALRDALRAERLGVGDLGQPQAERFDLFTRMLFSCLVDADRLDSAGRRSIQAPLCPERHLEKLLSHLSTLAVRAPEGLLKQVRTQVLRDCLQAAPAAGPLFSLSVPTGGGKTLAAMAFALRRAQLQPERFRRIIVVIPYLSIIEQNAQVYADIFGADAVLEHHSGSFGKLRTQSAAPSSASMPKEETSRYIPEPEEESDEEDDYQQSGQRLETENWDAPLIVTTSVRFFESLFSNRPRDLRRVHNIARSIVVLDEVQTLPRKLLGPLLGMMDELSGDWGVNFVFSTATLPAVQRPAGKRDLRWDPGTLWEIVREPEMLRKALRRTEIHWEIEQPTGWPQVAERALGANQCLAIVNLRRHASELYREVLRLAEQRGMDPDGIFHLSTRMCAAHRLRVLSTICGRLLDGKPCHVVSTQLVEAGVDVDFPLVMRALAPLDSIVQAAGRADREGKRSAALGRPGGEVVVFLPEDNQMPPNEYALAAGITEALARAATEKGGSIQVDSTREMAEYFERYYGEQGADLGSELVELRRQKKFATLADRFEMISSRTRDVFVRDDDEARKALDNLLKIRQLTGDLQRRLQRHVVGLNPSEFEKAKGALFKLQPGSEVWIAMEQAYDDRLGLIFDVGAEKLIL